MMHLLYTLLGFLWLPVNFSSGKSIADAIIHEELEKIFVNCSQNLPLCENRFPPPNYGFLCDCDSFCTLYGTCCLNSPYRNFKISASKSSCTPFGDDKNVEILDKCPLDANIDKNLKEKCEKVLDEYKDDLKLFLPVTSFFTSITYRNIFCFRCYEAHENYLFWHARFVSFSEYRGNCSSAIPVYNSVDKAWMAPFGRNRDLVPVAMKIEIPPDAREILKYCVPNIIRDCVSEWRDEEIKEMCNSYTLLTRFSKMCVGKPESLNTPHDYDVYYRNPHCALCNFQTLGENACSLYPRRGSPQEPVKSFTMLLDMNSCDSGEVRDTAFNECKKVTSLSEILKSE